MRFDPQRLKQARERKGWTQKQLAKAAKCGLMAVWAWENGRRVPNANSLGALASALGVSTSFFYQSPGVE